MIRSIIQKIRAVLPRKKPVVIYFAPHQDDELLTMGIDACGQITEANADVHVVLCSDGSRSNMRFRINDGKSCPHHEGIHQYELDIPAFVAARDREFAASCDALGFCPENVHILPHRALDGEITVEYAQAQLKAFLSRFPRNVTVCTISPFGGEAQHKDHRNLGQAALNLYNDGTIRKLRLFIEPYCVDSSKKSYPDLQLTEIRADAQIKSRILKAIEAYSLWAPDEGRYAIGFHSVYRMFGDFTTQTTAYFHLPRQRDA